MPLIPKPHVPEKETIALRIECALNAQLRDYATFAECTKEYVVDAALRRLFKHDKEFVTWCAARQAGARASTPSNDRSLPEDGDSDDVTTESRHRSVPRASRKERA